MDDFMRMQEGLDRLQGISLPEDSFQKIVFNIPNGEQKIYFNIPIEEPERKGTKVTLDLNLITKICECKITDIDGKSLIAEIVWTDTYVAIDAFENLIWNTNSTLIVDWLTEDIKMGFLIEQERNQEPFDRLLETAQDGDLDILTDPRASFSTIRKRSLFGIGLVGLGESHVVVGQMNHWDGNEMKVGMNMEDLGHAMDGQEGGGNEEDV